MQSYQTVMVISDLSQLAVAAEISDSDKAKIAVGMDAIVDINAHGQFNGKVARLPIEKNNNNNNYDPMESLESRRQSADRESIDDYMIVRSRISLRMLPAERRSAYRSSSTAVKMSRDSARCAADVVGPLLRASRRGRRHEAGSGCGDRATTATQVEIIKGLEPGQKVVGK